ncbi:hypothetical protein D9613_000810 [Agrocybe pediades]|uniref:Homeobox domain-containing protein n=1 Tax=Agrocybe pediades TaxID=84607 RepID=A0A8H4QZS4_9AGAR|nr:hypothetical protein D9613_000810 [Agrocybe pediades]
MGPYPPPILPNNHDSPAVDFRAFYPYTPNEVKHRKRTTTSQLKVLEAVFRKDTKPNASLRNELALELNMTARGVQVWFQNRRAKEKVKGKSGVKVSSPQSNGPDEDYLHVKDEGVPESLLQEQDEERDAYSNSTSPPQLHVITDAEDWKAGTASPAEPVPDSAPILPIRPPTINTFVNTQDIYAHRRGSLPANAFPQPMSASVLLREDDGPDPFFRRSSMDASLQRLANNPFAPLARAKNSALFGAGFGVVMPGSNTSNTSMSNLASGINSLRPHRQFNRLPYGYHASTRRVTGPLSAGLASTPYQYANLRRLSMDSRSVGHLRAQQSLSQSPSPITPYNAAIRVSLPDQQLYALSSRPLASPIPGPLPSPGFSFGAANTPSMTSPSSGDSERNSPDSLRSFNFRGGEEQDDDAATSYDAYSRFGSIASIATSESSIASSYYAEIGSSAVGVDPHLAEERRDSCASGHFLSMLSGLDVGNANPMYSPPEEFAYSNANEGAELVSVHAHQQHQQQPEPNYPSPTSTITPRDSPHAQDMSAVAPVTNPVSISSSSELAYALEGKPDQNVRQEQQYLTYGSPDQQRQQHQHQILAPEQQHQHDAVTYYSAQQQQPQDAHQLPLDQEQIVYPTSGYSNDVHHQHAQQLHDPSRQPLQQTQQMEYMSSVYTSSGGYADGVSASASVPGGMDNGMHSHDAFAAYT